MAETLLDVVLNPVRMKVVCSIARRGAASALQLAKELPEVPQASLYRHIRKLADSGVIQVVEETRIRGTIERTYAIARGKEGALGESASYAALLELMAGVQSCFAHPEQAQPEQAQPVLENRTLTLTPKQYQELCGRLMELSSGYEGAQDAQEAPNCRLTMALIPTK